MFCLLVALVVLFVEKGGFEVHPMEWSMVLWLLLMVSCCIFMCCFSPLCGGTIAMLGMLVVDVTLKEANTKKEPKATKSEISGEFTPVFKLAAKKAKFFHLDLSHFSR